MADKTGSLFGKLGSMLQDGNRQPLGVGSYVVTQDATGSPVSSPVSVANNATTTITVPNNATKMVVTPAQDMRFSDDNTLTRYSLLKANVQATIEVGRQQNLYFKADVTGGNLYFHFVTV